MIKIKHLKTLQTLKNSGSLSSAALKLNQTQSAISHQLIKLEKRLGFDLFFRNSKPLKFSTKGKILLQLAEKILPKINQSLEDCFNLSQSKIRIAIECHTCIEWFISVLYGFNQQYPNIKIEFKSDLIFDSQKLLKKNELDIVFTSDILPDTHFYYFPIFDFEYRLILAPSHPLSNLKFIAPENFSKEILMTYPIERKRLDVWKYFLKPSGMTPLFFKSVDNTLLMIQMTAARMGIAVLPHWLVGKFEKQGIIITKPFSKRLWSGFYAAIRKDEKNKSDIKTFIYFVCQHIKKYLSYPNIVFKNKKIFYE